MGTNPEVLRHHLLSLLETTGSYREKGSSPTSRKCRTTCRAARSRRHMRPSVSSISRRRTTLPLRTYGSCRRSYWSVSSPCSFNRKKTRTKRSCATSCNHLSFLSISYSLSHSFSISLRMLRWRHKTGAGVGVMNSGYYFLIKSNCVRSSENYFLCSVVIADVITIESQLIYDVTASLLITSKCTCDVITQML